MKNIEQRWRETNKMTVAIATITLLLGILIGIGVGAEMSQSERHGERDGERGGEGGNRNEMGYGDSMMNEQYGNNKNMESAEYGSMKAKMMQFMNREQTQQPVNTPTNQTSQVTPNATNTTVQ